MRSTGWVGKAAANKLRRRVSYLVGEIRIEVERKPSNPVVSRQRFDERFNVGIVEGAAVGDTEHPARATSQVDCTKQVLRWHDSKVFASVPKSLFNLDTIKDGQQREAMPSRWLHELFRGLA